MGSGCRSAIAVRFQPALDGALGVDAVESDANRLELSALGGAADRLWMQTEQFGQLARLVMPLDQQLVSRMRLEEKLDGMAARSEVEMIANLRVTPNMSAVE